MNSYLGASLTAAGVTFDIADFRDPQLDQLTPIQVTKDGRVYGHLAGWKTNHIGYSDRSVKPPKSPSNYKYFHQSIVPTSDGDLPVGHLTLGTGHAGGGDSVAAAAHYDNTGTQAAAVRAGEDRHGIWVAGRVLPGTDDMQKQTLRRSSLSGDWRKIDGQFELVAALAVNVPGFPIPRTETLVASAGAPEALVAAGIVRNGPITRVEVEQMVAAAAADAQQRFRAEQRRNELAARADQQLAAIAADNARRRRDELVASGAKIVDTVRRDNLTKRFNAIVAAGVVDDAAGHMPADLHKYWTKGKGLARWAPTATPYRSLVSALQSEIKDMTPEQIKGLAANLYHDVFHQWPGKQNKDGGNLTASLRPPSRERARRLLSTTRAQALLAAAPIPTDKPVAVEEVVEPVADPAPVHTGGMVALVPAGAEQLAVADLGNGTGEPAGELHLSLVYLGDDLTSVSDEWRQGVRDAVAEVIATEAGALDGTVFGRAALNEGSTEREACAVYLVEAPGLTALREKLLGALGNRAPAAPFDAFVPHITAGYGVDIEALLPAVGQPVAFDRIRVAIAGDYTDIPLGADDSLVGEVEAAAGPRRAQTQEGADKYGVSIGDVIGQGIDDAAADANTVVDATQRDVTNMARAIGEAIFGKRTPAEPVADPVVEPVAAEPVVEVAPEPVEPVEVPADDPAAEVVAEPTVDPETAQEITDTTVEAELEPEAPAVDAAPAPRKSGTGARMEEDEAPDTGARGGTLIDYSDGVAHYSDGSSTDGSSWSVGDQSALDEPATAEPIVSGDPIDDPEGAAEAARVDSTPTAVVESDVPTRTAGEPGTPLEEDQIPETGADGGGVADFSDGVAHYDDGTSTDGESWSRDPVLPGMGYDGETMLEDQAPLAGAEGGSLVDYSDGTAYYDDGTQTDGQSWTYTEEEVTAAVFDEGKHKRDLRGKFSKKSVGDLIAIRDEKRSDAKAADDPEVERQATVEADVAQEVIEAKVAEPRSGAQIDSDLDRTPGGVIPDELDDDGRPVGYAATRKSGERQHAIAEGLKDKRRAPKMPDRADMEDDRHEQLMQDHVAQSVAEALPQATVDAHPGGRGDTARRATYAPSGPGGPAAMGYGPTDADALDDLERNLTYNGMNNNGRLV